MSPAASPARWLWPALLCGLISGCAVGPNFHAPPAPAVSRYTRASRLDPTAAAQGAAQRFLPGGELVSDWYRLFGSDALTALIDEARSANPALQAAQASLRSSEDALRAGYGVFYPQIGVAGAAMRERTAPVSQGLATSPQLFNLLTLSASVNYALDLFGGERRQLEALAAQVQAQRATEQATYLTLLSNLVDAAIAAAAYRDEIQASRELIGMQQQQVHLAQIQAEAGTAPYSTVLSLQSQLASEQATIPPLEQKLSQSEDLMASLTGRTPAEFAPRQLHLAGLHLPRDLPISLPSELVRQRPDVLLAEASAHAASAQIGVATAAMLPSVTLRGDFSANARSLSHLMDAQGRAWDAAAQISQPLLEGGSLWYRRRAAIDSYRQADALYRQTVLQAFQQVADTLEALGHDASALQADELGLATARQALQLVQSNYAAGLATYLEVLSADAQFHQAQIEDLQGSAVRLQDTVALYAALGGGWWNAPDATSRLSR